MHYRWGHFLYLDNLQVVNFVQLLCDWISHADTNAGKSPIGSIIFNIFSFVFKSVYMCLHMYVYKYM